MADLFTTITAESPGASPYEFDSVTVESGNSFEPSTDVAHGGSYSYKCGFGASNDGAYAFKEFNSGSSSVYISFYIYLASGLNWPYGDNNGYIAYLFESAHGTVAIGLRVYDSNSDGVPDQWRVMGQDLSQTDSSTNFSLGAWHHIEMWYEAGSGDGVVRVWVDDDLIFEDTSVTNTYTYEYLRIGISGGIFGSGDAVYYDDISGADEMPSGGTSHQVTIQDSIGITDELTRSIGLHRTIADEDGISDLLSVMSEKIRTITDTAGISDSLSRALQIVRSLSDTLHVSDILSRAVQFARSIADSIGVSGILTRIHGHIRALADTEEITDLTTAQVFTLIIRSISDTVGITDAMSRTASMVRTINETVGVTDTLSRIGSFFRSVSNTVGISDTLTRIGRLIRSITDALGITDSVSSDSSNRTYPSYITAEVVMVSKYTAEIINEATYTAEIKKL
jgi:hypothetical protein